ncbi:hypothetical protein VIGAN_03245300, partial [Vigna angularis var. angularis]
LIVDVKMHVSLYIVSISEIGITKYSKAYYHWGHFWPTLSSILWLIHSASQELCWIRRHGKAYLREPFSTIFT